MRLCPRVTAHGTMAGMTGTADEPTEQPRDDDGGPYGVFGEGTPRKIVGDSDEPPRRRPRKKS